MSNGLDFYTKQFFRNQGFSRSEAKQLHNDYHAKAMQAEYKNLGLTPQGSIFQSFPYGNPYMQPQQPANPMQSIMEMMQTMMPMMMMCKMMGIDAGDMFSGMTGKTEGKKTDKDGWTPEEQTAAEQAAGITKYKNKKDKSTKEVQVKGDDTTTTITNTDNTKKITIENQKARTKTIKEKDVFYTQTRDQKKNDTMTSSNEVTYAYTDTNNVQSITVGGTKYSIKTGQGNKFKDHDIFIGANKKEYYYIPEKGLVEVPKK